MRHQKIISILKHTFIPHKENNYKPHFFREHVILSLLISAILLLLVSFTSSLVIRTTKFGSTVISSVLIDLTNQKRVENNLPLLSTNNLLTSAALMKGNDMVSRKYFAHFAPDGTTPWYWFNQAGYNFLYAGENLAINFRSSNAVENAWMASPKHRDNILGRQFKDIGIATVPGYDGNKPILFVVQLFGTQDETIVPDSLIPNTLTGMNTQTNAKLYEKLIFNATHYIGNMYIVLIAILIVALLLMIFIEIRKQHLLHIIYGVLLIVATLICVGINTLLL